jgi:hypothetical protein
MIGITVPKPWTPEIVSVLESLIKEFQTTPVRVIIIFMLLKDRLILKKRLKVANRLGLMMPKVAHLVHMPSHIYIRTGYYDKGVQSNVNALNGYDEYLSKFPAVSGASFLYLVHNVHLEAVCAQMDARYTEALKLSIEARNSFDSSWMDNGDYWSMYSQYVYMTPFFTQVRFGKWDDILNAPAVPASRAYATAMWHFSRGLPRHVNIISQKPTVELSHIKDSAQSSQLQQSPAGI